LFHWTLLKRAEEAIAAGDGKSQEGRKRASQKNKRVKDTPVPQFYEGVRAEGKKGMREE
jgi:hypothetical protein